MHIAYKLGQAKFPLDVGLGLVFHRFFFLFSLLLVSEVRDVGWMRHDIGENKNKGINGMSFVNRSLGFYRFLLC